MLKLECNVCKTVYEAAPSKVQTEYRTGRKFIRCPKDGAIAYQEGWNSVGVAEDNSEAQKELQETAKVEGDKERLEGELSTEKAKTASLESE